MKLFSFASRSATQACTTPHSASMPAERAFADTRAQDTIEASPKAVKAPKAGKPPTAQPALSPETAGLEPLRRAVEAVRTCLTREPTAEETRAAQVAPTDFPKSSVDVCTLGAAAAHRRAQRHHAAGNPVREKLYFAGSVVGHGLFVFSYPLTVPLAALHYNVKRGAGCEYLRKRTTAGVHLDMAAANSLQLRRELRAFCKNVVPWGDNGRVSQEDARAQIGQARKVVTTLLATFPQQADVKVQTSHLLRKHLQLTSGILLDAEMHMYHWGDTETLQSLPGPHGEVFTDRLISPRFFDDLSPGKNQRRDPFGFDRSCVLRS